MSAYDPAQGAHVDGPRFDDDGSPYGQPVTASPEEIRYAEELRLQLRESYRRKREAPVPPWCVGAD